MMEIQEHAKLLAFIAIGDNRTVDEVTISYWEKILPEWVTYEMAQEAVIQHRRTSSEYLDPAHIIAIAKTIHDEQRAQRRQLAALTELQETRQAAANALTRAEYVKLHPEDADKLPKWWHEPPKPRGERRRRNPTRIFEPADIDDDAPDDDTGGDAAAAQ